MVGIRLHWLNVINGDLILVFQLSMRSGLNLTLKGVLIDGGNLSLKALFSLERDVKVSKDVYEQI